MLEAGGLQTLLQHLHDLLRPIITPAQPPLATAALSTADTTGNTVPSSGSTGDRSGSSANDSGNTAPGTSGSDGEDQLAVAAEDLDILLAVLEALAASDAATDSQVSTKVSTTHMKPAHVLVMHAAAVTCSASSSLPPFPPKQMPNGMIESTAWHTCSM